MAKISQREARNLRKRVAELEQILDRQRSIWASEWPKGIHIDNVEVKSEEWHIVNTARKLGHAVVAVPIEGSFKLRMYGCPLPK